MTSDKIIGLSDTAWQGLHGAEAITLIGASQRVTGVSLTEKLLRNNEVLGYSGPIHFVNPKRREVHGKATYPTIGEVPPPVGAVIINLPDHLVLEATRAAIEAGASSLMIHSGGFAEAGKPGVARQSELQQMCAEAGIAAIGPNCLGFISVATGVSIYGSAMPPELKPGPVAAITQSGSVAMSMMTIGARSGMSHMVSTGNEAVTGAETLGLRMIEDEQTEILLLFLETLRQPDEFIALAERAHQLGKPIVALKVGLSERGGRVSRGHTGALSGPGDVYRTAFADLGVKLVSDFDELAHTTELLLNGTPSQWRGRVAVLGTSGGKLALVADLAEEVGLPMADFTSETEMRLRDALHLPSDTGVRNPLDVGTGFRSPATYGERFAACLRAAADDPSVDIVAVAQDLLDTPGGSGGLNTEIVQSVADEAGMLDKRAVLFSCESGELSDDIRHTASHAGVPTLHGARAALTALARAGSAQMVTGQQPIWDRRRGRINEPLAPIEQRADGSVPIVDVASLLDAAGINVVPFHVVSSADEAAAVAERYGQIVMKVDAPELVHKSDAGGVVLGLNTAADAMAAYERLAHDERWNEYATIVASPQLDSDLELFIGATWNHEFGPMITFGLGGTMVELAGCAASGLAPVDEYAARELVERALPRQVLSGFRGAPPLDTNVVQITIRKFSELVADLDRDLEALEVNPIIVNNAHPAGVAVDCRLLLRWTTYPN